MRGNQLLGFSRLAGAAMRADLALRQEQPSLRVLLCVLLAGPLLLLALLGSGASMRVAALASVTGGCCALWTLRSLPVHFAPLLALLIYQLFLVESGTGLMSGLGLDVFWWMLGSMMLALAAWETGLIGALMSPQDQATTQSTAQAPATKRATEFAGRLLAGLAGLYGTRAAPLLAQLGQRDRRIGRFAYHLGRLVGLPSHVLNLFMVGLLAPVIAEHFSLLNWAAMMLVPAVALAGLSVCASSIDDGAAPAAVTADNQPRRIRLTLPQWLSGLALLLAWLGAAFSNWHGLPPGVLFLYLGLMVVAAGLLPVEKFTGGIDWSLLLAFGIWIGLTQTIARELRAPLANLIGAAGDSLHPIALAAMLLALVCLTYRYAGLLRGGLILLPLASMVASANMNQGQGVAGWMLIVLLTLHWLDISGAQPARTRGLRIAVAITGLGVIALTGAVWHRLGII